MVGQKPIVRKTGAGDGNPVYGKGDGSGAGALGAETVAISVIESMPLMDEAVREAFAGIDRYRWVVFTSGNGVEIFFDTMKKLSVDIRKLMHLNLQR